MFLAKLVIPQLSINMIGKLANCEGNRGAADAEGVCVHRSRRPGGGGISRLAAAGARSRPPELRAVLGGEVAGVIEVPSR